MKLTYSFLSIGLATSASAFLATTTRYYDGQEGACGCGTTSGPFSWQLGIGTGVYTAAGSQALYDTDGATWCGAGCGKCYNLTSTGSSPCSSCGDGGDAGESIIVMITNLCPYDGNEEWCPQVDGVNQYGYSYHFDIMAESIVFGDNPIVNFEPVACPGQAVSDWDTCVCYGETETDVTPVGLTTGGTTPPTTTATTSSTTSKTSTSTTLSTTSKTSTSTTLSTSSKTTSSTTSSTTSKTATSTTSSSGAAQTLYGQCGGIGWTGATTCVSGATCTEENAWYSQCLA